MIKKGKNKNEMSSKFYQKQLFTSNESSQQGSSIDFQKFPSPTFNIHIHVPSYNTSDSKIYLPRIQPEIHLHFDEIAKRLEINKMEQNEESLYRIFENLLSVISPKFGDVKFHFKNKSGEKKFEESDENNETPCSTRSHYDDSLPNKRKDQEKNKSDASDKSMVVHNSRNKSTSKKNSEDINDNMILSKYKDLKIKKAVVVLTDICKSKTWENVSAAISDSGKSRNTNKYPDKSLDQVENNPKEDMKYERCLNKQENESITASSPSPGRSLNENFEFYNCFENNCGKVKVKEIVVNTSSTQESTISDKSLTALAEGCSFSEILSRFQIKCNQYVVDTAKPPRNSELDVKCSNEEGSNCCSKIVKNKSFEENDRTGCDSHGQMHEDELDLDKNVTNDNTSDKIKNIFHLQITEDNTDSVKQCCGTDSKSDKFNITSVKHLSSEVFVNSETLKSDSSIKTTSPDHEDNFEVSRTKGSHLFDVGNVDFHLELIKKEMQRRSQRNSGESKKNKTSKVRIKSDNNAAKFDKSSQPKRMKRLNEKLEKKTPNSSTTENYIPLNASGPTKFAVAPLDIIHPYKTHSAKTFKQEMLFGNRVTRFSSSDQLRMYKSKQQARRNSAKK